MSILKSEKMVPYVYPNESRDFQLLLRLYDYLINGVKHDIDQIKNVVDTEECNNKILHLLQSKVGFFSSAKITDDELRAVLSAFPYIIRNKGSVKSITQAVNVYCKVKKITEGYRVVVFNKDQGSAELTQEEIKELGDNTYVILIEIMSSFQDTTILDEIFKYILPPAYGIIYMFMSRISGEEVHSIFKMDTVDYEILHQNYSKLNMEIYNTEDYTGNKYVDEGKVPIDSVTTAVESNTKRPLHIRDKVGTVITSDYWTNYGETSTEEE